MICRLCLNDIEDFINIFGSNGQELKVASVVSKHFWFEPRKDDPISTSICKICWVKVYNFNAFYEMVEHVHRQISERFTVKRKSGKEQCCSPDYVNDLINYSSLPNKTDPDDEFDELSEPFNMLIEDNLDEPGETITKAAAIASLNTLSDKNLSQDEYDDRIDGNYSSDKNYDDDGNCSNSDHFQNSHSNDSFDGETFTSNILTIEKLNSNDNSQSNDTKRRRCEETTATNTKSEEQDSYWAKIKEGDDQVARFMTLHCDVCNVESKNFADLKTHMREVHSIKKGYAKCCNKKFLKRAFLLEHIRYHLDPACYKCKECDRTFANRRSMKSHFLIKHQKDEDKAYDCSECSKKFARKCFMETHKKFVHRDRSTICKPITCKSCHKRFNTLEELYEHNKQACIEGIICDICAKVIKTRGAFKRHQLRHQNNTSPKIQCDLCGSWHRDKYALSRHKSKHTDANKLHICDICHKVSPTRSAMLSHKRYVHIIERTYECGICIKTFKTAVSLKEHMTTHTGEDLYTCLHCPKTFKSRANMYSHRKKMHPQEFEESIKIRKQNAHLIEQPIPTISDLSKAKTQNTDPLLVAMEPNDNSHCVLITTSTPDDFNENEDVTDLSNQCFET